MVAEGANLFQGNHAGEKGGDVAAFEQADVHISHAYMLGSSAENAGGAIAAADNACITLVSTQVVNATAKFGGGCISLDNHAHLTATNCVLQGCRVAGASVAMGGGMAVSEYASAWLINTTLVNNTAKAATGGIHAVQGAGITLQNVTVEGNYADIGGGMAFASNASLALVGVSHFQRNHASEWGGAIIIGSSNFTAADVLGSKGSGLLVFTNNTATNNPDVHLVTTAISVVGSNSSLDNFVANLNSEGGLLHFVLNTTGPQGLPTNGPVNFAIETSSGSTTNEQELTTEPNAEGLREISAKVKQRPGGYQCASSTGPSSTIVHRVPVVAPPLQPWRVLPASGHPGCVGLDCGAAAVGVSLQVPRRQLDRSAQRLCAAVHIIYHTHLPALQRPAAWARLQQRHGCCGDAGQCCVLGVHHLEADPVH